MSAAAAPFDAHRKDILGHPRGLATLFFTEMWERFSYYGMRALLVLFMVEQIEKGGLGYTDQTATAIYGLYTAFAYLVCLPGGWIADRLWGAQRAIWVGGVIIMLGHFILAVPSLPTFFLGLMLVCSGTGLLKPNVSAVVGQLYAPGDPRRDAGFTIFYMGINVGGFLGPLVCGWLATIDWHYGFAAAGVGMLFGLIQFRVMRAGLGDAGVAPASEPPLKVRQTAWSIVAVTLAGALLLLVAGLAGWLTIDAPVFARWTAWTIVGAMVLYFGYVFLDRRLTAEERRQVVVILVLVIACALFWAGFEQAGSSLNLFAERFTMRDLGFFEIPAAWFQSLNSIFIIALAPGFAMFWLWLARRNLEPAAPAKFAFGLIILGLGFVVMIGAATLVAQGKQAWPTWLVFTYLLHTMGELALSPVGLSAMTKLAPQRFAGQMMGMWFMCTALGNSIAGLIAGTFDVGALDQWPRIYTLLVIAAVASGLLLLAFSRPLRRMMGDVR